MTTEQWQKVKEVYDEVAAYPAAEWPARLALVCDDAAVRVEVEQLLGLQAQVGEFLERPPQLAFNRDQTRKQDQTGKQIGAYRLLREIGRGGMGTVYLAERADDVHRKQVAVKLVWPGFDSAEIFKRFRQERHILAELDHPNIARLLDGGTTDEGWSYVVMEYVDGEPLTRYCNQHKLSVAERLRLFQQVCAAVNYAHRSLVVHRDLKPSNILVTRDGTAKLLDFGIAKILDPALRPDSLSLTNTGMQAMTPEYASPEQVRGETITTATDVYSLGVLLYELLTGHPPYRFPKRTLHEVMRVIAEEEPLRPSQVSRSGSVPRAVASGLVAPSDDPLADARGTDPAPSSFTNAQENTPDKLRRRLTGDLDNIILKALRKEPEQRYLSVEQFSEDITRHLTGKTVIAQAPTFRYRAGKFVRRNKAGVAFASFIGLLLIGAVFYAFRQARQVREQARQQRYEFYLAQLPRIAEDWQNNNIQRMNETLAGFFPKKDEQELRGFEWYYLWRLSHRDLFTLHTRYRYTTTDSIESEQKLLVTSRDQPASGGSMAGVRSEWQVWNAQTGREIPALAFQFEDGSTGNHFLASMQHLLIIVGDHEVRFVNYRTKQELPRITSPARIRFTLALDAHGNLVIGDETGAVTLWNALSGMRIRTFPGHSSPVLGIRIRSRRLFVLSQDGVLAQWNWETGQFIRSQQEPETIKGFDATTDGKWLLTDSGKVVRVQDAATGREVAQLAGDTITACSLLQGDARLFLARGDRTVKLYEFPSLRLLGTFTGHSEWVHHVASSPDGKMLITGGQDRTLRLWDLATQRQLAVIKGHTGERVQGNFSSDGRRLITYSDDYTVKVWDVDEVLHPDQLTGHNGYVYSVAFSSDGRTLASAGKDHTVRLWDAQTNSLLKTLEGHTGEVFGVAFSPDGRRVASSGEKREAKVWDVSTGRELFALTGHTQQIHAITYSPDGQKIATASDDNTVRIWDAATGKSLLTLPRQETNLWSVAFTPDGRRVASGSFDGFVRLCDAATGEPHAAFKAHDSAVWSLRFTADGARLLTGSLDHTAKLWNLANGKEQIVFNGHQDEVFCAIFSPDERRVVTASNDHAIKIWDAATGRELLTLKDHTDQVWSVAFAPDGHTLASASWDGTVRLWRAASEQEVQRHSRL